MLDPTLFASVPFRNLTAVLDFAGTFELYHRGMANHLFATQGLQYTLYPTGSPGGPEWLKAIQDQCAAVASALGLGPPPDLADYDLDKAEDHVSFFFVISQEMLRLRDAAGLT